MRKTFIYWLGVAAGRHFTVKQKESNAIRPLQNREINKFSGGSFCRKKLTGKHDRALQGSHVATDEENVMRWPPVTQYRQNCFAAFYKASKKIGRRPILPHGARQKKKKTGPTFEWHEPPKGAYSGAGQILAIIAKRPLQLLLCRDGASEGKQKQNFLRALVDIVKQSVLRAYKPRLDGYDRTSPMRPRLKARITALSLLYL